MTSSGRTGGSWSPAAAGSSGGASSRGSRPPARATSSSRAAPTTTCGRATAIERGARRRPAGRRHPPRGRRRRDRRQPREPGPVLLRERDHGHPADGAARGSPASRSSSRSAPSAPTRSSRRCRSARTTSGTATRRRRTRRTAWRRRCSSSRARRTAQQYGFNVIHLIPVNLYGPGDNFDPASSHVIPALIKKCVDARERGADHIEVWGTGRRSREFLYVDDAAEGIVLAAERYDGAEPGEPGRRAARSRSATSSTLIARLTGFTGEIRWDRIEARRPAAAGARHEPGARAVRVRGADVVRGRASQDDRLVQDPPGMNWARAASAAGLSRSCRAPRRSGARAKAKDATSSASRHQRA